MCSCNNLHSNIFIAYDHNVHAPEEVTVCAIFIALSRKCYTVNMLEQITGCPCLQLRVRQSWGNESTSHNFLTDLDLPSEKQTWAFSGHSLSKKLSQCFAFPQPITKPSHFGGFIDHSNIHVIQRKKASNMIGNQKPPRKSSECSRAAEPVSFRQTNLCCLVLKNPQMY